LAEKQVILLEARGFKPTLTTRDIPPTVIYVQSTSGTLHAMDAETGKTLWAVTVGNPRWPMLTPAANDDYVATINGSSLYLLDRATGEPVWNRPVGMNPTLSLAMSDAWVFVPGLNGQVEGYRLPTPEDDSRVAEPWVYHSGVQVTAAPTIGSTTVSWATDRGQMFVADLAGPAILYRRQAGGPIHGRAMFLPPDRWVVASTDGYVTALDERSGAVQWELSTGSDIYHAPITQSDFTYVVTRKNELFCISSADGLEQWMSPGIEQLLACGSDRIFARGTGGRLVALDKQTGKPLGSLAARDYRVGYSNYLTDRIYLLTTSGTMLCLREETAHYPTLHVPLPQPKTTEAPATTTAAPAATEAAEPTPPARDEEQVDVFGADMFDNDADDAAAPAAAAPDAIEDDSDAPAETPPAEDADETQEETDDPFDFG
jgi:hypothetical protein